jgi:hypothetical protein
MADQTEHKKKRERSPGYPAIPLGVAVERTRELYKAEKSYLAPVDTVISHWGYSPRSGAGLVQVAALMKYGLLEDEGSGPNRRARVTEFAQRIIRDSREVSPDRDRLIREAALNPSIHRELWERFGASLPSDSNLLHTLVFEYGFTDPGAAEFLKVFKATVAFAGLTDDADLAAEPTGDMIADTRLDDAAATDRRTAPARPTPVAPVSGPAGRALPIPIASSDQWPTLYLPGRITEADWTQMIAVLQAMKPGIVAREETSPSTQERHDE